jgi:hypothetical protein
MSEMRDVIEIDALTPASAMDQHHNWKWAGARWNAKIAELIVVWSIRNPSACRGRRYSLHFVPLKDLRFAHAR